MDLKEQTIKCKKEEWYDAWFAIEVLGMNEDVVRKSLENHVQKLSGTLGVVVYEKGFKDVRKVEKPMKGVESAFSQVVNLKLFAKDLPTLLEIVMLYGPSSIEIMGPGRKAVSMADTQDICNVLAGLVHQFAAAGAGGIVISPGKNK